MAVWTYTPRRIAAYGILARLRVKRDRAEAINDNAVAARGNAKDLKDRVKGLVREL